MKGSDWPDGRTGDPCVRPLVFGDSPPCPAWAADPPFLSPGAAPRRLPLPRAPGDALLAARLARRLALPFGFPRRGAVGGLALAAGASAAAVGDGIGPCVLGLARAVGPEGRVFGVELTDRGYERTGRIAAARCLRNVVVTRADAGTIRLPRELDGIVAVFAVSRPGGGDGLVWEASQALRPGGRLAVVDFLEPDAWSRFLRPATAGAAGGDGRGEPRPRCLVAIVARHLEVVSLRQHIPGLACTIVGEAS